MKLESIIQKDQSLLYMERYVGKGTKTYSPFATRTEAAPCYRPESGQPSFDLFTVDTPRDRVSIFKADPSPNLVNHYIRPGGVLFAIHPETWTTAGVDYLDEIHALPRAEPVRVAPTASTRTVLTLEPSEKVPPHYIKLHYPVLISRFNRRLMRKNIENSVAVTRDVAKLHFDKFAYLPDVLGFTFGSDENSWGFLVRETTPRPIIEGRFLIPSFALYGEDYKNPDDLPLLVQMIERLDVEPVSFAVNEIFVPIIECWCLVARRGLLFESHAQNTLLEIDQDFRPRRIVHRDFDVWIDMETRRRADLEMPFLGKGLSADKGHSIEQYYSLIYDRFIGHGFFDYLLDLLKRFYSVDEESVRSQVRKAFHQSFPEADRFFPTDTMFYFSKEPPPGREFMLEDMQRVPEWR
ncbi:IucA/IucC family C-terminal-domain containing protein [Beijerinckia indica]|uniref:Siderophore synthetase component-like protein n=1 Tax=Beijerinckia indica subsp. indica (strain ATCC 9039 / DSM 1715 / NCIMB 8712) TaxID=395963 RepID=B2IIS1_BEII9|nr:IucA/IucC family C-terminal-domain containing protein [Beijerinckia indica]ACB96133.1 Siderophore synthetase component-like protein [Beijerinckia indica subsp. indica ATCC 9039]